MWCAANSKQRQRWLREYEVDLAKDKAKLEMTEPPGSVPGAEEASSSSAIAAIAANGEHNPWDDSDVECCDDYDADVEKEFNDIQDLCEQLQQS